jgi:DNA polymerase II small subunit/DNA polymerase delta subunit B
MTSSEYKVAYDVKIVVCCSNTTETIEVYKVQYSALKYSTAQA